MAKKENRTAEDWETYLNKQDALPKVAIDSLALALEVMKRQAEREAKTATLH